MLIKVLGTGCAKCNTLEQATKEAIANLNVDVELIKVDNIMEIMEAGVMRTPALIIDDEVMVSGKVPKVKDLETMISKKL